MGFEFSTFRLWKLKLQTSEIVSCSMKTSIIDWVIPLMIWNMFVCGQLQMMVFVSTIGLLRITQNLWYNNLTAR